MLPGFTLDLFWVLGSRSPPQRDLLAPRVHLPYSGSRGERRGWQRLCLSRLQLLLVSPGGISAKKVMCKKIEGKY